MSRIVVLGSLNMDLVAHVPHLPSAGETVLAQPLQTFPGGKGANQAAAAARLGGRVSIIGRVGADAFGTSLLEALARDGVDTTAVERDGATPTGTAIILVDPQGENVIAVSPGANATLTVDAVDRALQTLGSDDMLVIQLEIPATVVRQALTGARERGVRTLLNAAPIRGLDPALLRGLDILVVNEPETAALVGRSVTDLTAAMAAALELHERGVGLAVVTLGAAGAVFSQNGTAERVEPFPVTAVDSTAAGDAFVGAMAAAMIDAIPTTQALRLASAAGAAAASRPGAHSSLPRRRDLEDAFGLRWP
ncbi:MAG TPA: ribokinase [Candidatus Dormibacteraeota bacterium]|jgi:ribokinase